MLLATSDVALATIICNCVFTAISTLSFTLHIYVRIDRRQFSIGDCFTFAAFVFTFGLVGQSTWAVLDGGQGQHISQVSRTQFELIGKSLLVNEALWAAVNTFIRLSALLLLHKIFSGSYRFRHLSIIIICCSIMHGIAGMLTAVLICRPIQAAWDSQVRGSCGNQTVAYVIIEVYGLAIDVVITSLPIPMVLGLQLPMRERCRVILLLSVGMLVTVITGLRIAALHKVNTPDFSYDQGYLGLLSTLGALIGVTCCCGVSLNAFVGLCWKRYHERRNTIYRRELPFQQPALETQPGRLYQTWDPRDTKMHQGGAESDGVISEPARLGPRRNTV
ncbi:hypothetical protein GGR54DRAFT_613218 [Hypoxylon sp. NC1633]|nr:hypothetical protein GGR54DRAFT_613218 [Hypoxylon sp. NC1633]